MSSAISFKGYSPNANGAGGVVSGLDWKAMTEAVYKAETQSARKKEEEIEFSNKKVAAYAELKNLAEAFFEANDKMRNIFSPTQSGNNHLRQKIVSMSASNGDNAANYLTVTPSSQFDADTFQIKVDDIALNEVHESILFNSSSASVTQNDHSSTQLFTVGNFTIEGELGSAVITIEDGDSLDSITAKINLQRNATGVSAKIVRPSVNGFKMQWEAKNTGADYGFTITDPDNVLNSVMTQVQAPTDAQITYNNSTVTRPSNRINDFVDNLVLNLKAPTPAGEYLTISIDYDTDKAKEAIVNWADSYNNFVKFVQKQQQRGGPESGYVDTAILRTDPTMNKIYREITSLVGEKPVGENIDFNSLSDIGLIFGMSESANAATGEPSYQNLIVVNEDLLNTNIQGNIDKVQEWFEFKYDVDTTKVRIISRSNNFPTDIHSFSLAVNVSNSESDRAVFTIDGNTVNATFVPNDSDDLTKGGIIKGVDGTVLEGFVFSYTGTGLTDANFSISRGISDKIYNFMTSYFEKNMPDPSSTSLEPSKDQFEVSIISEITVQASKMKAIKEVEARASKKIEDMVRRYSRMEGEIAKANNLINMMEVLFGEKSKN